MARKVGSYEIGNVLGRGTYGDVREATHTPSGKKLAIKMIDRAHIVDPTLGKRLKREIAIMKLLDHPHVVSAQDVLQDNRYIYIAMELISGGELFTEITTKGKLSEAEAGKYMMQLIDGLSYCHQQGIVHRNLKPENLLLDKDKNLKITDFGVANFLTGGAGGTALMQTKVGSHDYVAPEVLTKERYRGPPTDVWSCGVILFAMLAGALPFEGSSTKSIFRKICSADFRCPDECSDEAADLLHKMLVVNPDKRIKIEDICAEPWFKGRKLSTHAAVKVNDDQVDGAFVQVADRATPRPAAPASASPADAAAEAKKKKRGPIRGTIGDYNLFGVLGEGAFSRVFKCVYVPTDKEYAMKVVSKRLIKKKKMSSNMGREIAIMKKLDHPHVVVMREALGSAVELFLVLDLVAGGSVREALEEKVAGRKKPKKLKFTEARAKRYMLQLFDGLGYCHSRGVCHRDLKPDNLMLDLDDNLKIADFGLGNFVDKSKLLHTRCGTPHYVAPEVIAHAGYEGEKADIWSCGVIAYRMLYGQVPFLAKGTQALYKLIRHASYEMPDTFSDEAQDLIRRLLVADPQKRVTLEDAMVLPWFTKSHQKSTRKLTHERSIVAPSQYSIRYAIKPVLRKGTFAMNSIRSQNSLVTPRTPAAAAASPANGGGAPPAAAAVASPMCAPNESQHIASPRPSLPNPQTVVSPSSVLFANEVKIQSKTHMFTPYTTVYKAAIVSVNDTHLSVVVDNADVNEPPFPLLLNSDFSARNGTSNKRSLVIKLPDSVAPAPKPKYYRFLWSLVCEADKTAAQRICERMFAAAAPPLSTEATLPSTKAPKS